MAIAKKALGNKYNYYDIFEEWIPDISVLYYSAVEKPEAVFDV